MTSAELLAELKLGYAALDAQECHDGEEENGHYGWGASEAEAIEDLRRLDKERAEAMEIES